MGVSNCRLVTATVFPLSLPLLLLMMVRYMCFITIYHTPNNMHFQLSLQQESTGSLSCLVLIYFLFPELKPKLKLHLPSQLLNLSLFTPCCYSSLSCMSTWLYIVVDILIQIVFRYNLKCGRMHPKKSR